MQRTVALKVLPFAALAGEKALKRFHNEVRAAALLDHPHIVSAFSVGEEQGIHYYAMQYVRGQSLAAVIADLRAEVVQRSNGGSDPPDDQAGARSTFRIAGHTTSSLGERNEHFRNLARLGIQAAEAIQHAHEQGVIHRDIKPANLLLDANGQLRVTDFGLANIESDANLTGTGELAGTLRYMSPEQALGRRDVLDQRTDVYSLGATLYELLTLQPVFVGDDRGQLLEQVCNVEPLAPRELDSGIPADLETILLKSLEKESIDRYSSAADLAEDLRRFSLGQTIRAKRPSAFDKISKWALRNRSVVATGFVMAILICVVLAASTILVWQAKSKTQLALEESQEYAAEIEELLYTSDIQRAFQAFNDQRTNQVRNILDRNQARSARFEWRLLETLTKPPPSTVIGKHVGSANELAVFPDGQRLASVGDDGKLHVWRVDSGTLLATIEAGDRPLHSVAISPDGQTIATGSEIVQLWNVASGKRELVLPEQEANVEAITFSPDGRQIVTGTRYDCICLFSRDGKLIRQVADEGRHYTLGFTVDGTRLLVPSSFVQEDGNRQGIIRVWRSDMSVVERELDELGHDFVTAFPGGDYYLAGDHHAALNKCVILNELGEQVLNLPAYGDKVTALAISSEERFIAAGLKDGYLNCWRIARNAAGPPQVTSRPLTIKAHAGQVHSIQFAGPQEMVTCGKDGLIKAWHLPAVENPQRIKESPSYCMAISPDGSTVATIRRKDRSTLQLLTASGILIRQIESDSGLRQSMSFSPNNEYLATSTLDRLQLRDSRSGEVVRQFSFGEPTEDFCFSPFKPLLAIVTCKRAACLQLLDLVNMRIDTSVTLPVDGRHRCEYSPDGDFLVCVGGDLINVFDAHTLSAVQQMPCPSDPVSLTINRQGTELVTGHRNGVLRLWEFPSLQLQGELAGHRDAISAVSFSPDGQSLVSASRDLTVRLWSMVSQKACGIISQEVRILDVEFSPDGRRVYAAVEAGGLMIYTVE